MLNLKKINKILEYYKKVYTFKNIIIKIIFIIVGSLITILPSFLIREAVLLSTTNTFNILGNFLVGQIEFNQGISFSGLSNNPELASGLQIFVFIAVILVFLNNKYIAADIGIIIIALAGLTNIIDREIPDVFNGVIYNNTVVDYLKFGFIPNSTIFNWQDVFIILGTIWVLIYIIIQLIFKKKESREEYAKENNVPKKR